MQQRAITQCGTLYLIPVGLGDSSLLNTIPSYNIEIVQSLTYFICENAKNGRVFLKQCQYQNIGLAKIEELNQHTNAATINLFLEPLLNGFSVGLMSDAGCPAIADPGSNIVKWAHQKHITVKPMVGPSSILLSAMASGFNGQSFAFIGYLPIDKPNKIKRIKELELFSLKQNQAQYFIETPYRNSSLFEDLLATLKHNTQLLVATDLTMETEQIFSTTINDWKKTVAPNLNKRNTVFGIYAVL